MTNSLRQKLTDKSTLERIIDSQGLNWVKEQIASICHDKADHIDVNYRPARNAPEDLTARAWRRAGNRLDRMKEFSI